MPDVVEKSDLRSKSFVMMLSILLSTNEEC